MAAKGEPGIHGFCDLCVFCGVVYYLATMKNEKEKDKPAPVTNISLESSFQAQYNYVIQTPYMCRIWLKSGTRRVCNRPLSHLVPMPQGAFVALNTVVGC
jgi:hypothetical protein